MPDQSYGHRCKTLIAPGDTLVVPSDYGGADEFGWDPRGRRPVADVADACLNWMADAAPAAGRGRAVRLRLHPALYRQLLGEPADEEARRDQDNQVEDFARTLLRARRLVEQGDVEDSQEDVRQLLLAYRERLQGDRPQEVVVDLFLDAGPLSPRPYPGGLVLTRRVAPGFSDSPRPLPPEVSDVETTTEDDTASLLRPVPLEEHAAGVVEWVSRFAHGLDEGLVKVLQRAAWLHDLGKADARFQVMLYGGDPVAAAAGELLAKSGMEAEDRQAFWRSWQRSGLPPGFRHELVSVALVRAGRDQLLHDLAEDERELVEYLVGTHHGRGRPFVPVVEEDDPNRVTLTWDGTPVSASPDHRLWHLGQGWADLFWRLVRRYGVWGLAYLEAVLVLADQARSHQEEGGAG